MKILTLNTWQERGPWEKRWEVILHGLDQMKPDLVAFQELFNRDWAQEVQKRTGFPTLLFPDVFCGLVIYSRYPVSSWGAASLTQSPLEEYTRSALWAELQVKGKTLLFVNTHLSWQLHDGASRLKQLKEIVQFVQDKAKNVDAILVGDLNAPSRSPEIQWLVTEGRFHDLFQKHPQVGSGFTWDNRNPYAADSGHKMPDRRIDYILTQAGKKGPSKLDFNTKLIYTHPNGQGVWASDHFGVLAESE